MTVMQAPEPGFDELPVDETLTRLGTSERGLSPAEVQSRLAEHGPNEITEQHRVGLLRELAGFFWGPIPWMIEVAAILSGALGRIEDLAVILTLLVVNAGVGFWEQHRAQSAIDALKEQLAPDARVCRDGTWSTVDARDLVPGDLIALRLGQIVPADAKLVDRAHLGLDESALTGESLPVDRTRGGMVFSGTAVKTGESRGVVVATGGGTRFARTAQLVEEAERTSHYRQMVFRIARFLIALTAVLALAIIADAVVRGEPVSEAILFALVLTIASIPVALPAVLTVTMAIGAHRLAGMQAIVSQLDAIEEMASLDVLCSDKTGTLTKNQLTLQTVRTIGAVAVDEVVLGAALTCEDDTDDPIDRAVLAALAAPDALDGYRIEEFRPFDPDRKYADADVSGPDGMSFTAAKGAPQVIAELVGAPDEVAAQVAAAVEEFAGEGDRALGVARCDQGGDWRYLGVLALLDPPRDDAAEEIARQRDHGLAVKMLTGDHLDIARTIAHRLGLGADIRAADDVFDTRGDGDHARVLVDDLDEIDGFAQVTPEHKFAIVRHLQQSGHRVGMTGDGVNDAPALKQADTGIAVSGATQAARAAAALVLTAPGLSAITGAIEEARRIFARMSSYATFRVAETARVLLFVAASILVFATFPVTPLQIVLLVIMNDIPIMTIAYDNVRTAEQPVRFEMGKILTVASVLGVVGVAFSFGLFFLAHVVWDMPVGQVQTLLFLKLLVAGHLTIYLTRNDGPFWSRPLPNVRLVIAAETTQVLGTLLAVYGWLVEPIGWRWAGVVWGFSIAAFLTNAGAKWLTYRFLARHTGVNPFQLRRVPER